MSSLKPELRIKSQEWIQEDIKSLPTLELQQVAINFITKLARGEVRGTRLETKNHVGDLSDCHKLYFDLTPSDGPRYRIIFRYLPIPDKPEILELIAIGKREDLFVYYEAIKRLGR